MPVRGRIAGGKSRQALGLFGGLWAAASLACTTPTVAARAVWIGREHGLGGSRPLFIYSAGEITESALHPVGEDGEAAQRVLVEVAPRGGGALIRGVDDSWIGELGSEASFRAGYIDAEHRRVVPLVLPGERVPANVASFTAAGDALAWGESCPPRIAVVPLSAAAAPAIDADTGGVVPLRSGAKAARAGCSVTHTPAVVSAADAPVIFKVDAQVASGRSLAQPGGAIEALRYPTSAGDEGLELLGVGRLPAGHRPVALAGVRCPGGDPSCGIAVVDPDGAAISVAVEGGDCRLLRWTVGVSDEEDAVVCAIAADAAPELDPGRLVAAISAEHYVLRDGVSLIRYAWATREIDRRPLVGELRDATIHVTADGRAVVMLRAWGPMLRVDAGSMELISIDQRDCPGAQAPVLSPSGRHAAWTCTLSSEQAAPDDTSSGLTLSEVVRVTPGGMDRYQGVPMWVLAIDDAGDVLLHSRGLGGQQNEVDVAEDVTRASNLYVLAADGELARVSTLEPDPEITLGLSPGTSRLIAAQPL